MEQHNNDKDELLTLREAAAKLHRSIACVRSWVSKRELTAYKINRTWFIRESEVLRRIDENLIPRLPSKRKPAQTDEGSEYETFILTSVDI